MIKYKKKILPVLLIGVLFTGLAFVGPVITKTNFKLSRELLKSAETKYGKEAVDRLTAWETMIRQDNSPSEMAKLTKANRFFNAQIQFVNDIDLYGMKDYWATPIEFLCRCAGDCEDFAIAKYFTLKAMGIPEAKLNIQYVKALQYNMAHMVLSYFSTPGAEPLILDNLIDSIEPGSKRTDLLPVFSFNGTSLWLAKQRGRGKLAGSSSRLKAWGNLLDRMAQNKL